MKKLNVSQAAAYYDVSTRAIYRWIDRGWIKAERKPSGRLRVVMDEDQNYVADGIKRHGILRRPTINT